MGKQWKQCQALFLGAPKSLQMVIAAMKLKDTYLGRKVVTNLDSILKGRDITLPTKVHLVKAMVFPVVMYGCEIWMSYGCELSFYKESWGLKNWCFWTMVLEKTLESPLNCKEIQPVHPKGDQSWLFIGRTDAEAEAPILWPPDVKSWLIWKDPDTGKDLRAAGEGVDRGWDGWMASLTQWSWVWVNSGSWWWTGRPGMLWFMGSQRVGHNWATELKLVYFWNYMKCLRLGRNHINMCWIYKNTFHCSCRPGIEEISYQLNLLVQASTNCSTLN